MFDLLKLTKRWLQLLLPPPPAPAPVCSWARIHGYFLLPEAASPHVPAFVEMCLTPVWLAYKLVGPRLAWRLNNHPMFASTDGVYWVGNGVVWGQLLVLLAAAAAVVAVCRRSRGRKAGSIAGGKHKAE